MTHQDIKTAAVILGVFALTAFIQRNVIAVPVVGAYLPGGTLS